MCIPVYIDFKASIIRITALSPKIKIILAKAIQEVLGIFFKKLIFIQQNIQTSIRLFWDPLIASVYAAFRAFENHM